MINRLKKLFASLEEESADDKGHHSFAEIEIAAATLLVEAAMHDGEFHADERSTILKLVTKRFDLSAAEGELLLAAAVEVQANATQLLRFTRAIKDHFDEAERIELIELMWEVVYADGVLDDFEANLMRRVAGLIYVADRASGHARRRVMERLGLSR